MIGGRRTVCGELAQLPGHLMGRALVVHGAGATWTDIKVHLRCVLETHEGAHQDFVISAVGDYAVWVSWATGQEPESPERRQDCPDDRGCCLWDQHPGRHTKDVTDPLSISALAQVDQMWPDFPVGRSR